MKTELDKIMEWYEINLDCQRVISISGWYLAD